MLCTNLACNREHFFQVRYCPYCGAPQALAHIEQSKPSEAEISPAVVTPTVEPVAQAVDEPRNDDKRLDDELWAKARELGTIRALEQYLHTNTQFKKQYVEEAEQLLEKLAKQDRDKDESLWKKACKENTVEAYEEYRSEDLSSRRHADEARNRIKGLTTRLDVKKGEPAASRPVRSPTVPSAPTPRPVPPNPSTSSWWKVALVAVAIVIGYFSLSDWGGNEQSPRTPGQQTEIPELLRLASIDIGNDRLTRPSGNNALEKYRRILSMQPEHPGALQGIKDIAARYFDLHKQVLARGDANKARMYLESAQSLDPDITGVPNNDASSAPQPELTSPTLNAPPPLTMGPSKPQQDESRCTALVEAGLSSLNQKPTSDYERAIVRAMEARSIMPDCPGAAGLLKQATNQRDFFIAERLRKEREDSVSHDRCQVMVTQGKQALQVRRYDQALRYAANARNAYAQCPGVDMLEKEANTAIATANQSAEAEKQSQCVALVSAGNDALLRRDYSSALRNAAKANRLYPNCPGATDLEGNANKAICTQFVMRGQEAMRASQFSNAVTFSRRAISTYARCPGAESLEQEAMLAMNILKDKADQENQERAQVRCEAFMDAGRDALNSKSYDEAINNAKKAKRAYPQCPGADALERETVEAKRKAMDNTAIY